ncbi:MAG: glycosyltransferase [Acidobacteria bacterium]|nr:MAG: glycosyltransferase [Acidobacteriota bacterium]REK01486.1 MAG: glycosyltransferase [Acidobacteriota bacterium]REK14442.1 MAG: glycosyltransferase [Acidobacteriota bacterium]REK45157.1 MAG: glycosyltransferase [Acidobacteriota bacterium]
MNQVSPTVSVVTPTFLRPGEVEGLLENISAQNLPVLELILVDGAPEGEETTRELVRKIGRNFSFPIRYIRRGGGTAIQRNVGIDEAKGDYIALVDDDVRLDKDFLEVIAREFRDDPDREIGGIVGYRTNQHFTADESARWKWYRRLRLLKEYEPGRYDFHSGYPINANLQAPFSGTRSVDFMTTACAVWRREVFETGLRFHEFFKDYGVLEDAHFSLRAGRDWKLLQAGDARCVELRSPHGRVDRRKIGAKCVMNYYFVFRDIAGPLSVSQQFRFWRYQAFEFIRISASAIRRRSWDDVKELRGRIEGMLGLLAGLGSEEK